MTGRAGIVLALALLVTSASAVADENAPAAPKANSTTLARFSTTYLRDAEHRARAENVELAAEAIDGKTIRPGTTFSFNDAVGERTAAFGFGKSVVIRDRMMTEGMGGGTCQVASTLYAAALLAGLEIVSRAPHTRPSAYIRMGLDATVAYPKIDLKLTASTIAPAPVVIHARAVKGELEVTIAAVDPLAPKPAVSVTSEVVERLSFERVLAHPRHATLPASDVVTRAAYGIPGYRIRRTRTITSPDGVAHREMRTDLYPATDEVLEVPNDFDPARLDPGAGGKPVTIVDAPTATKPAPVQLRPSTVATLDNGGGA